jgi:tetratricopeptide (TPR) repeat protein
MSRRSGPRPKPPGASARSTGAVRARQNSALSLDAPPLAEGTNTRVWLRIGWILLALFGVALLAVALGPHKVGDNFAETDFYGGYAEGARALQHGHLDPARYGVVGPGYEVALALLGLVVPDLLLAAELLSVLSILLGAALWMRLLAARADARLALAASLFIVTNATFFRYGYSATNDSLAFALMAASLFWLLARPGRRAAILAGLLGGLAFLTRYNAVVLLPAGLVALLAGGTPQAERRRAALLFAAGFLAPILPWVAFSLARGQSFHFQFFHNIAYDVFARSRGIAWDDYQKLLQPQFHSLGDVIARDPGAVVRREAFNVWDHLRLDARSLIGLPVAFCALIGLVLSALDGTLKRLWPILLVSGLLFLSLVPIFNSERYGLPLIPCYAALAAAAFTSPRWALVVGRSRRVWLKPLLAAFPLVFALQTEVNATRRNLDQLPVEVLDCAETLRALRRPGDGVICRKPQIAFHGGVSAVPFPFTRSLAELAQYARARGTRWLYFSWPEAEMRPGFWYLLDTTSAVPGLTIRRVGHRPAILYEIGPDFGREPAWAGNDTLTVWHMMRAKLWVNPSDTDALLALASIEHGRGQLAAAQARLEQAVRVSPRLVPAWLLLGEIALTENDGARARLCYERVLAIDPQQTSARVGLGWSSLVARDAVGAARIWRPLIGDTHDPATLERMAQLFGALGDRAGEAEARAALARAERMQ